MKFLKKILLSVNLLSPISVISCNVIEETEYIINFDGSYQNIDQNLVNSKLNFEKFNDKKIKVKIKNINNKDFIISGFINKKTIIIPGKEEKVNLIEWVLYVSSLSPKGVKNV